MRAAQTLNMSAVGPVSILPVPLALTVAFLNNPNVLLSGGVAAGFKRDLHEKELQPFDFDYVEYAERGRL